MASWVKGKCLGKGSFGTVSLGVSKIDGRVFAVKSVDLKSGLRGQLEALENEIRILRSLSSPYVVGFLGDDAVSDCRNLHMEYMPGGTVADMAARDADVEERVVRYYTWCLVNALSYVHSRGVVHCDVKGRNVLVGPNGCAVKLADFGSAVEMGFSGDHVLQRGSPLWMAPEVIRREYQGPESDVWSLGCTVIEMVSGKPAWEDCGVDTLSRIGYSGELPEFPSQLSELGRDFLEKCLRRETSQRWSCDQLLQHPFLCSASPFKLVESSPRCVLDWLPSDFTDDDDEEEIGLDAVKSAKNRIGKLAASLRASWESDNWVTVRPSASQTESADDEVEGQEGTTWEYPDLLGVSDERANLVYSDESECLSRQKVDLVVRWEGIIWIYCLCCELLNSHFLLSICCNLLFLSIYLNKYYQFGLFPGFNFVNETLIQKNFVRIIFTCLFKKKSH